jgi:hypothetical protein
MPRRRRSARPPVAGVDRVHEPEVVGDEIRRAGERGPGRRAVERDRGQRQAVVVLDQHALHDVLAEVRDVQVVVAEDGIDVDVARVRDRPDALPVVDEEVRVARVALGREVAVHAADELERAAPRILRVVAMNSRLMPRCRYCLPGRQRCR